MKLHKIYVVLTDEEATKDGDLRIVYQSREDYLYSADYFVIIELPKIVQYSVLAIV